MSLTDDLTRSLETHLGAVAPPPGDPAAAMRRGRGIRRRRTALRTGGVVGVVAAVALGGVLLARPDVEEAPELVVPVKLLPPLDLDEGLRAVASPGQELWLGGQVLDESGFEGIDVAGATTSYGLVFFAGGRALLLDTSGTAVPLSDPVADVPDGFGPTARADAVLPLVAFTVPAPDGVRIVLHDLEGDRVLGERVVDCAGAACSDVRVEAVDRGLVFVRTPEGPFVWDTDPAGAGGWTRLGPEATRVVDVRGGRILWSDAAPEPGADSPVADWPVSKGATDAQLTLDGGHVLSWSGTLRPTTPGGEPVRLDARDALFFAVDTDGSVLAATYDGKVWDCALPSGRCESLGRLPRGGGDPAFVGTDM